MTRADGCAAFDCCECGRAVLRLGSGTVPEPPLCAICLMVPGWMTVPEVRAVLDPCGTAREPDLTAAPAPEP